ncbi:MAG TPA: MazG family protein [Lacisediminihabitans sp.]|jgi:XTP/dITP diphosphohydrolase|nr:MazG family protein [Lacisediminihabitans sp.]HXD61754.1 MazG family protein [Lacisediminihabitans sp.]
MTATYPKLEELIAVLHRLRAPGGCAWDAEQTHESLVQYLVEESYELVDAIETADRDGLLEELGDVLYQVIFHADIAAHTAGEDFTLEDVAEHMTAKMVSRHPHVFGDAAAQEAMNIQTGDDVVAVWEDLKKADKPDRTSVLDGIPQSMPALALAGKLLGRAEKVGLSVADFSGPDAAAAIPVDTESELGAVLLAIVSGARERGLDAERALRTALRALQNEIRGAEAQNPKN